MPGCRSSASTSSEDLDERKAVRSVLPLDDRGSLRAQTTAPGGEVECTQSQNCGLRAVVTTWPYAVLDLRAGYRLSPNWEVALGMNNVFDKRYYLSQDTLGLQLWYGEPRNFMLRIDAKF
jgi:outer membrane receptor protein involved in Fe transport